MEGDTSWSLGTLIGVPVAIAIFIICVALASFLFAKWRDDSTYDAGIFGVGYFFFGGCAIATVVMTAVLMYPYHYEYHQYRTNVGEVAEIKSRLLGSSDSFQQKFVARFTDGRELGCEDTRCALVKPGDTLVLSCKRQWQYAGKDGYDCKYIDTRIKGES